MKIVKRKMSQSEQILLSLAEALANPSDPIDYVSLTTNEYEQLYSDVAAGKVPMSVSHMSSLAARQKVLGVPLRIEDEKPAKRGKNVDSV